MARVDYTDTPDNQDFPILPEGEYLCEVENVGEGTTKAGDEMWSLRFRVLQSPYLGRCVFDNLVLSEHPQCKQRAKLIFKRLGFDVSQPLDVQPMDLMGKQVYLTVEEREYKGKRRNGVPFAGYRAVGEEAKPAEVEPEKFDMPDEEVPF